MNQLIYNFLNEIEDANKINEMTVEEFSKLVNSNNLISEDEAKQLIESFKKIVSQKNDNDDTSDTDQRKKKYRQQHKELNLKDTTQKVEEHDEKENENDSLER